MKKKEEETMALKTLGIEIYQEEPELSIKIYVREIAYKDLWQGKRK